MDIAGPPCGPAGLGQGRVNTIAEKRHLARCEIVLVTSSSLKTRYTAYQTQWSGPPMCVTYLGSSVPRLCVFALLLVIFGTDARAAGLDRVDILNHGIYNAEITGSSRAPSL